MSEFTYYCFDLINKFFVFASAAYLCNLSQQRWSDPIDGSLMEKEDASLETNPGSKCAALGFGLASGGLLTFAAQSHANLTIVPTFDSTITSDPNAATIEATINTAISSVESYIANPVTVSIDFEETNSGLAESETYIGETPYTTYLNQLKTATPSRRMTTPPWPPFQPLPRWAPAEISSHPCRFSGRWDTPPIHRRDNPTALSFSTPAS